MNLVFSLRRPLGIVMALVLSVWVAACGGGGSSAVEAPPEAPPVAPDVINKYVGSWLRACENNEEVLVTITKLNPTTASYTSLNYDYAPAAGTCAGTPTLVVIEGSFAVAGNKLLGSDTVDKVDFSVTNPMPETGKDIFLLNASQNSLRLGDPNAPEDADGYPTQLATTSFVKQ